MERDLVTLTAFATLPEVSVRCRMDGEPQSKAPFQEQRLNKRIRKRLQLEDEPSASTLYEAHMKHRHACSSEARGVWAQQSSL
jgi:hypothetical protein